MGEGLPPEAYEFEDESDVLKNIRDELQEIQSEISGIGHTLANGFAWFLFIMLCSAIVLIVYLFRHW